MFSGISAPSFRIVSRLSGFYLDGRTEKQFIVVMQNEIQDIIILRLGSESHFTDSFPSSIRSKTPTQNGFSKNTVRLAFMSPDHTPLFTMAAY